MWSSGAPKRLPIVFVKIIKLFVFGTHQLTFFAEVNNVQNHRNVRFMGIGGDFVDRAWPRIGTSLSFLPSAGVSVDF